MTWLTDWLTDWLTGWLFSLSWANEIFYGSHLFLANACALSFAFQFFFFLHCDIPSKNSRHFRKKRSFVSGQHSLWSSTTLEGRFFISFSRIWNKYLRYCIAVFILEKKSAFFQVHDIFYFHKENRKILELRARVRNAREKSLLLCKIRQ